MSRLSTTTLTRALRSSRASSIASIRPLPSVRSSARSLFSSTPRYASEVPKDPLADPDVQNFYEKLRNHQGAVDAMMKIGQLMKDKGVDTSKPPSMMQMMKLSMDKDMREAGQNLVEQMREAGVEMSPEVMKGLFEKMRKQ